MHVSITFTGKAFAVRRKASEGRLGCSAKPACAFATLETEETMSNAATKTVIDTPLLDVHRKARATIGTWFGCALPDAFGGDWLAEYRAARDSVALIDFGRPKAIQLIVLVDR